MGRAKGRRGWPKAGSGAQSKGCRLGEGGLGGEGCGGKGRGGGKRCLKEKGQSLMERGGAEWKGAWLDVNGWG